MVELPDASVEIGEDGEGVGEDVEVGIVYTGELLDCDKVVLDEGVDGTGL